MKAFSSYTSDKLKIISLFLIMFVINCHSSYNSYEIEGMIFNIKLQKLFTGLISERLSTQLFFIISGYLFFLNLDNIRTVFSKIFKRVNSLLIPYIIACTYFVALSISIALIPYAQDYMNWSPIYLINESWIDIIKSTYYDYGGGAPLAFHLWFLRNLIIIIALSPVLFYIHKYLKYYFIPIIFLMDYLIPYNTLIISLLWFYIGGCIVFFDYKFNTKRIALFCLPLFFIILFVQLFFNIHLTKYIEYIITIFNIITLWCTYDLLTPRSFSLKNSPLLKDMCSITFFLYLFHLPIINIIKKVVVLIIGKNSFGYAIGYLGTPFIFLFLSLFITLYLKKYFSKVYTVSVGGR